VTRGAVGAQGLRHLDFSYNRIASLPTTLGQLTRLESLDVQSNRLLHLPPVLCKLDRLTMINIVGNRDLMIPKEVLNSDTAVLKIFLRGVFVGLDTTVVDWSLLKTVGDCRLRTFPARLFTMGAVTELILDDNRIHRVPPEAGNLSSLVKLSMRHNLIEHLPDELACCRQLEKLFLDHNRLKTLPEFTFKKLPLRLASFTHNRLDSECIPESLGGKAGRHVTALILESNAIGKISSTIDCFRRIKTLNFCCNQVRTLPLELAHCRTLTDLQFDCNQVSEIPSELRVLTNLVRLKFNDNRVENLPSWIGTLTQLLHLGVGKNQLQVIPDAITKLRLKVFTIDGNPLCSLETGVLLEGSQAVVEYLTYNHEYDQPDKDVILGGLEQRRQIDAKLNEYAYAAENIARARLEASYRRVGGRNAAELARNKLVGQDRTDSEGAVIVDEGMLQDVLRMAERDLAASALSAFFGLGLTGDKVSPLSAGPALHFPRVLIVVTRRSHLSRSLSLNVPISPGAREGRGGLPRGGRRRLGRHRHWGAAPSVPDDGRRHLDRGPRPALGARLQSPAPGLYLQRPFSVSDARFATPQALEWIMSISEEDAEAGDGEPAAAGIRLKPFQDICYNVYSSRN